ncbi:hypothetical protein A33K_13664 [Burkholderia humptydooensis MSMB43]|uniref:Uncharacterized protein n=1 Tax=Burkholderia humptydooensis MSMB43 TaxID=441157 RepID=A0ABN0GCS9_9BURK|nr:hypothetical protein A33K_13664 [Burkholderia humptydooensis MSMB43]
MIAGRLETRRSIEKPPHASARPCRYGRPTRAIAARPRLEIAASIPPRRRLMADDVNQC